MKFWCKELRTRIEVAIDRIIYYQAFYFLFLRYAFIVVGQHAAESALTGHILTEKDVMINPASVFTACLDENITMHCIKHCFSQEGGKPF